MKKIAIALGCLVGTTGANAALTATDIGQAAGYQGILVASPMTPIRQHALALENRLSAIGLVEPDSKGEPHLRPVGNVQMYGSLEGGRFQLKEEGSKPGLNAHTQVLNVGADRMVTRNALVGLGLSFDKARTTLDSNRGAFNNDVVIGSLFTTVALSKSFYVNGQINYGRIDYDITRNASGGEVDRGSTVGLYQAARVGGGFIHTFNNGVTLNPQVAYTQEQIKMQGYTETGSNFAFTYGPTKYKARRVSLALVVTKAPSSPDGWRPLMRVSLEGDLNKDGIPLSVSSPLAGNVNLVPAASRTGPQPDRYFELVTIGASKHCGKGLFNAELSTTLGATNIATYSLGLTYKHPFN